MEPSDSVYFAKLLGGIVHSVRNSLHGLYATAAALAAQAQNAPEAGPLLHLMQNEVSRLSSLTDLLQELREPATPAIARHRVNAIVEDGRKQVADFARSRGCLIAVSDIGGDAQVEGDGVRLSRAIAALLENAVESGEINRVDVTVRQESGAVIEISDNGEGIVPGDLERVREPFFTTRPGKFGLGATIASRIIASHSGAIEIASEPGAGTRVRILLPVTT